MISKTCVQAALLLVPPGGRAAAQPGPPPAAGHPPGDAVGQVPCGCRLPGRTARPPRAGAAAPGTGTAA